MEREAREWYLTCNNEDDALETTKRPRLSSTGFGFKVEKDDRAGGRKGKEGRWSKRRFTGEAQEHTNTSFQRNKFYQKHLPCSPIQFAFYRDREIEVTAKRLFTVIFSRKNGCAGFINLMFSPLVMVARLLTWTLHFCRLDCRLWS